MKVKNVAPLLQVYDMRESVKFYCDVLGFELKDKYEPEGHLYWALLKHGDAIVMLNSKFEDEKRPATKPPEHGRSDFTLYFSCDDVDAAYGELSRKTNRVKAPTNAYYGMRQMNVIDLDGFHLCFQHPVK